MIFDESHLEVVKNGVEMFNRDQFWECHEEFEHHWLENRGDPVRDVYWAIIQVAAALFHFREGNLTGAKGMLYKAVDKFERCEKAHIESELLNKCLTWQEFKRVSRQINDLGEKATIEDFHRLYQFKFPDPSKWDELMGRQ